MIGFLTAAEPFYGPARSVAMSVQTAVCVALLSGGTLACRPGRGRLSVLFTESAGGHFARHFAPPVLALPVVIAVVCSVGARLELYSAAVALWLTTLGAVGSLLVLMVWISTRLHQEDEARTATQERLELMTRTDPLTGIANRRAFEEALERASSRARRHAEPHAVCVIDLDHFKSVNDRYGHDVGDEALQRVALALGRRVRGEDLVARVGGDEFAVLLAPSDRARGERVAEQLAVAVDGVALDLQQDGYPSRLAASVGVGVIDGTRSPSDALRDADERMYRAKRRSGRARLPVPPVAPAAVR